MFVRLHGPQLPELVGPLRMSRTNTVPATVPSDFHSSYPCVPLLATKNSVPLTLVKPQGFALALPLRMSLTMDVPAIVPSVFQSSKPLVPLFAAKNAKPL